MNKERVMKLTSVSALLLIPILYLSAQGLAPGTKESAPRSIPPLGAPGAPATPGGTVDVKKRTSSLVGSTGGTYYRATSAADSIPPLVIQFSSTNQTVVQDWEEDLTVMTRLLEESLQRAADEDLSDFKLGIQMIVTANRSVRPLYLEGFGALFMVKVNFPVMPPSKVEEEKRERTESEWEKVRQELYGRRQASWMGGTVEAGVDYDSEQVDTLKKEMIESLKNASNFRHLKPDEFVSITVFGSANSGAKTSKSSTRRKKSEAGNAEAVAKDADRGARDQTAARARLARGGTVLTLRVKKADIDSFARGDINYDAFEKKVDINTYLGSGYGITSLNSWIQSTIRQYSK